MPDSTKTQQPTVEQMNQVLEGLPKPPSLEERMSATYNSAAAPQAASPVSTGADAKDAARLDWLDSKTIPFNMGWKLGLAPRGNLGGIMLLGNCKATVREAIDAAMSDEAGKV
jgi:hypothetical protein